MNVLYIFKNSNLASLLSRTEVQAAGAAAVELRRSAEQRQRQQQQLKWA